MLRQPLPRGVSAVAFVVACAPSFAQEALPAIDIGAATTSRDRASSRASRPKTDPTAYAVENSSTALKTDTPILQTPYSVQVVPAQVLRDQQVTRTEEAIQNVSGVQPAFSGFFGEDFIIRGFGVGSTRFRNGVRLPNGHFDFANVERVEVLKGSAAMLYGRTEPGGMINIVTRRPEAAPSYSVQQQFGSFDYYRTTVDATGKLDADGSLLYRFDASYLNAGSFRDFIHSDRIFLAPSVTWRPTNEDEFNLNFEYKNEHMPGEGGIPAFYDRIADVPRSRNFSNPDFNKDKSDGRLIDMSWTHRFDDAWTAHSGLVVNWNDALVRENYTTPFQRALEGAANPLVRRTVLFEDTYFQALTAYSDLTGKFDTGILEHEVLVGGNYFARRSSARGFFGLNDPSRSWFTTVDLYNPVYPALPFAYLDAARQFAPNEFIKTKNEWASVYFHDQIGIGEMIHVMGGGRYDWADSVSGYSTRPLQSTNLSILRTERFSPKAGIVIQPAPFFSLYGSYSEGFGSNNTGRSVTGEVLAPETSRQFEAGLKSELFDERVLATLAFFELTKQNIAVLVSDNGAYGLIGEARSRGVEFDVAGKVTDGVSVIANYALTDARITKARADDDHLGRRLPGAPMHSGRIWVKYDFQQPELKGLSIGAGVSAVSDRAGDKGYTNYYYTAPGYARVDLFASYAFDYLGGKVTAQLNINNVGNARYFTPGYVTSRAYNAVGEPLTVKGALRVDF
jgi:iron complex outermembrane receptor protein